MRAGAEKSMARRAAKRSKTVCGYGAALYKTARLDGGGGVM